MAWHRTHLGLSLLVTSVLLMGCGAASTPTSIPPTASLASTRPTKSLTIVTTLGLFADMVQNVTGDQATVSALVPSGAGPEDYQPTPEDAKQISQADLFFYNGLGLEQWLDKLFTAAAKPGQTRVALAEGLPVLEVGSEGYKEGNPHFWLNPQYGIMYVEKIRDALSTLDPASADLYRKNADAYITRLQQTDQQMEALANQIPFDNRKLVVDHDAWIYFAKRYRFEVVGSILGNPEQEPSAGELADLVRKIKANNAKAVFSESQFNPKLAQSLAQEANVKTVGNLYTDALDDQVKTYVDMLTYDMKAIVAALR